MSSIKEVAKYAGVGVGTVSRALNGTGYVSQETKEKVEKAALELNYTPNELARNLFRKRTGIIGIVVPDMEHPFFAHIAKKIEILLYEEGYKTMICNTIGISHREKDYLDMLDRNMVDGIITAAHALEDSVYLNINKPMVSLDRDFGTQIPLIQSDHIQGGRIAAEMLINSGCRRVGQIRGYSKVNTPSNNRHDEFERIMGKANIEVFTYETNWNEFSYENYRAVVKKFINQCGVIDGLFTSDISAVMCLQEANERGIKVPEELQIIGYDAMEITRLTSPIITAIKQNTTELAKKCVETIILQIDGNSKIDKHQMVEVTTQIGGTTKNIHYTQKKD